MQSLSELKAENEALESEVEPEIELTEEEEPTDSELGEVEQTTEELEDWQKEDGEVTPMFTSSDIKAAKTKVRAKLERKHESEVENLKAEIEELKSQTIRPKLPQSDLKMPERSEFEYEEDYFKALNKWNQDALTNMVEKREHESAKLQQQQREQESLSSAIDEHYERAVKLTKDHGINEDVYRSADLNVRTMADGVAPGKGDFIIENLISRLGEGSEKVMFYIGRNQSALNELQSALNADPSGLQAAMLVGSLKSKVAMPSKRQSNAAPPATQLKGDTSASEDAATLKRKYQKAFKAGDHNSSFQLRRKAKKAGVDVSKW